MEKLKAIIISMMLVILVAPSLVSDYNPCVGCDIGIELVSADVTVGDYFNITTWVDMTEDIDSWQFYNFTWEPASSANVTVVWIIEDESHWPICSLGEIYNSSGYIEHPQGFNMAPFNNTNISLAYINFTSMNCGKCYMNITDVSIQFEGTVVPINSILNATMTIHPKSITGSTATPHSDAINLTWTTPFQQCVDKCYVYANKTGYPSGHPSNDEIYNGTADYYNHTSLESNKTWYYTFWSWNETYDLWSLLFQQQTAQTFNSIPSVTHKLISMPDYNGAIWDVYSDFDDAHVRLVVSENPDMSSNTTYWDNVSSDGSPWGWRYHFQEPGLSNGFTPNCTVYYEFTLFNETHPLFFSNNSGQVRLWSPLIKLESPLDGAIDMSYLLVDLNVTVNISTGGNFTLYYFEGDYFTQKQTLNTTGGYNATYNYQWTNLNSSETYEWGVWVETNETEDNGNITARKAWTKYYTSDNNWSFTTETTIFSITAPYPSNKSEILRPPTNLSIQVNGDNIDVYFYLWNMTPIVDCWTQVADWSGISNSRLELTSLGVFGTDFIWGNTSYNWSVNATDGNTWINHSFNYTTIELVTGGLRDRNARYDVNNDATSIDVFDLSAVWGHRTIAGHAPYEGLYDVNNDNLVDVFDVSSVWGHRTVP